MSEITLMQKKLLEMIAKLHDYCIYYNIKYYAVGGTMLGMARHNGFIPWDDDMDIGMPRPDYERFLKQVKIDPIDGCSVESSDSNDPLFLFPYTKLYDISTTLIENSNRPLKRGIYIDIFPIDGFGDSLKEAKNHYSSIQFRKNLLTLRLMSKDKRRVWYKRLLLFLVQSIPACMINEKRLIKDIESLCRKKDYERCALVGNAVGAWGLKEVMSREYYGTPRLYKFENLSLLGVERFDEYLTHVYNNWRQLPPLEKQVSHHSYKVDFYKSYLDS